MASAVRSVEQTQSIELTQAPSRVCSGPTRTPLLPLGKAHISGLRGSHTVLPMGMVPVQAVCSGFV